MLPSHVLKGIEMGLIPIEHVIVWADSEIVASDKPELWLIELATRDTPDMIGLLQEHGASTEVDAETLLALVSYGFFHSRLALEQVRAELYPFFCADDSKQHHLWILDPRTMKNRKTRAQLHGVHRKGGRGLTSLRSMIDIFDDEMGWDRSRARRTCEAIL